MAIEIVDLPIKNGGSFHSYVTVYQRVAQKGPWQGFDGFWALCEIVRISFRALTGATSKKSSASHEQSMLWARATARPGAEDIRVPVGHCRTHAMTVTMVQHGTMMYHGFQRHDGSEEAVRLQEAEGNRSHTETDLVIWWFGDLPELFVSTLSTDLQHLTSTMKLSLCFRWVWNTWQWTATENPSASFFGRYLSGFCWIHSGLLWLCSFWTMLAFTWVCLKMVSTPLWKQIVPECHQITKWVCLKMLCTPLYPMVLLIIIPFWKMAISLGIYPTFSDKPTFHTKEIWSTYEDVWSRQDLTGESKQKEIDRTSCIVHHSPTMSRLPAEFLHCTQFNFPCVNFGCWSDLIEARSRTCTPWTSTWGRFDDINKLGWVLDWKLMTLHDEIWWKLQRLSDAQCQELGKTAMWLSPCRK